MRISYSNLNKVLVAAREDLKTARAAIVEKNPQWNALNDAFLDGTERALFQLLKTRPEALLEASSYFLKQGRKLASNYDLWDWAGYPTDEYEPDDLCDFVLAAFRVAVIHKMIFTYWKLEERRSHDLAVAWSDFGQLFKDGPRFSHQQAAA